MSTLDSCHPFRRLAVALFAALAGLLAAPDASAAARDVELVGTLNLNTATEAELRQLPGIGPAKAQRILELRAKRKFTSTEQLMNVKGIGRKTYRKLKANLALSGPTNLTRKAKEAKPKEPKQAKAQQPATVRVPEPAPEPVTDDEVEVIRALPSASLDAAHERARKRLGLTVADVRE